MLEALRVGLSIGSHDPFWTLVREAIYQRAEQSGIHVIPIRDIDGAAISDEAQSCLMQELLAHDLDALIGYCMDENLLRRILQSGLPVICASESVTRHPCFVSPLGLYDAAQIAGHYLVEHLATGGNVLIAGGLMSGGDNGQSRISAIHDILRSLPEIHQHHIPSPWDADRAYPLFAEGLQRLAEPLDAVFGLSDSLALAARDAGRARGIVDRHTLVVGINGDPLALAAISEGSMAATVETSAASFGIQIVDLVHQAAQGLALPPHFNHQLLLVTAENVVEVMKQQLTAIARLPAWPVGPVHRQEQRRLAQLETSLEISRQIGPVLDRQQLSRDIASLIRTHYGYDRVDLYLWAETEQALILDQPDLAEPDWPRIPLAQAGPLGQVLACKDPIFIPEVQRSSQLPVDPDCPVTRLRVLVPIRMGDAPLGLLDLHSYQPARRARQDLVGLQLLAEQLGVAMRNAELYDEAVRARTVAEKADRLKTRLLANVSHELRTPLNVIMGYSQSALASPNPYNLELPPELRRDLGRIYSSGEHLMRLINDLLDLSRAEIGELSLVPEPIAPRPFLEEVFHSIASSAASPEVAWLMSLPERLPLLYADPVRLRQILLNLLANARKFTAVGHILLGAEVEPPHLHVWVEDTGVGIPIDQQERIFEPFVTLEQPGRSREGIGLGLAVTRRLVWLHGGSITLESQSGRGSIFHVYLPLPSLTGRPVAAPETAQPVLLMIAAPAGRSCEACMPALPAGWHAVDLHPGDHLDQVLDEVRPMALAWDMARASPGEWALVQQVRNHPGLCQLPFILFDREDENDCAAGPTGVMTKPLDGKTLVDMIETLRPPAACGAILIVDDDPHARLLYQSIVTQALPGHPIWLAESGAEALAVLAQDTPALVILDLMMPEVDGFRVLEQMRADGRSRHVPVLVISGRILSQEDIKRLDHAQVVFESKDILSTDEIAARLHRVLWSEDLLPQPTSTLVKQSIAFIQENYSRRISRLAVARAVGVSEDYLGRIFRQELGISPVEYLNRYRIKEARSLLIQGCASITDVAGQVGFDDPAYFSRAFRKLVGRSPRDYRKRATAR